MTIDFEEFGFIVKIENQTFEAIETAIQSAKADYEQQKARCFPQYEEEPRVLTLVPTLFVDTIVRERIKNNDMSIKIGWYLAVPNEYVIEHSKSTKEKIEYLEQAKVKQND